MYKHGINTCFCLDLISERMVKDWYRKGNLSDKVKGRTPFVFTEFYVATLWFLVLKDI